MVRSLFLTSVAALLSGCGAGGDPEPSAAVRMSEDSASAISQPVELNPGVELSAGFSGERHAMLHGETRVPLLAYWSAVPTGRALELGYFPEPFYRPFRSLSPAIHSRTYTELDFSGFLPVEIDEPGQLWAIDLHRSRVFLQQFHPGARMKVGSPGRLAGPDGGFAALRAISPTHLEIVFRVHAEFLIEPDAYFTPAHFRGEILIDRVKGTVQYFRLGLSTEPALNATLTVRLPTEALLDIVRVERMELVGGDPALRADHTWTSEILRQDAEETLARVFYTFLDIAWVPFESALPEANRTGRPLMAVVLWGALDEQSC